jgi:hypothetical protein
MKQPIMVWEFNRAPREYRALSEYGGDEDWVVFVPEGWDYTPNWVNKIDACDEPQQIMVKGGIVYIGAHA